MKPYFWKKQPGSKRTLEFDPSDSLLSGDSVVSATAVMYDGTTDVSSTMIVGNPVVSGGYIYIVIQAGTTGHEYWLKIVATTANGDAIEDDLLIVVTEKGK